MRAWVLGLVMLFLMTASFGHETTHDKNSVNTGIPYRSIEGMLEQGSTEASSIHSTGHSKSLDVQGRGKKDDKIMHSMYMGMMMVKAFFSIIFMFVNGIFQLKSFGFSLLNAIINIGRFLMQYNQQQHHEQKVIKVPHDWANSGYGYDAGYGQQNFQFYPTGYSNQEQYQPELAPADKVYRIQPNQEANLYANTMAYSGYTNNNGAKRT